MRGKLPPVDKTGLKAKIESEAAKFKQPVSAVVVDTYGIQLPPGYTLVGDNYVFQNIAEADRLLPDSSDLPNDEDLEATNSFVGDHGKREAAYKFLFGDGVTDMRHVNSIEAIYATTPAGNDVNKVAQYLEQNGLGDSADKRELALEFLSIRSGEPMPEAEKPGGKYVTYRDLSGNDPILS